MPCIIAKFSAVLTSSQKDRLQQRMTDIVSAAFSKPKSYIMVNIEDKQSLYMNQKPLQNGAYLSIRLLGNVEKSACTTATKGLCDILNEELQIAGTDVYITYRPVELWGWNGSMF